MMPARMSIYSKLILTNQLNADSHTSRIISEVFIAVIQSKIKHLCPYSNSKQRNNICNGNHDGQIHTHVFSFLPKDKPLQQAVNCLLEIEFPKVNGISQVKEKDFPVL